jgi:hypothetical protein
VVRAKILHELRFAAASSTRGHRSWSSGKLPPLRRTARVLMNVVERLQKNQKTEGKKNTVMASKKKIKWRDKIVFHNQ